MEKKFKRTTVTSALPYANGPVHIGHLAGVYVPADIYVRYLRLKKEDVIFIGGSDEHGVPITIRAKKEGITPQDVVDRYHTLIKKSFEEFGVSFDVYSRTTSKTHHDTASDFFRKLYDKGEFIEKTSMQYYDEEAKTFLADRYITGECWMLGTKSLRNLTSSRLNALYTTYIRGLREWDGERAFYPDANLTLRVAYGSVAGYEYADGEYHTPQTTLDGIIAKDNPEIYDYDIPQALRDLYASKEYGRWATEIDGRRTVPVCFLATNHTTGGNSGSPIINGRGELVGLNFDRTWRSTMSDIAFDPSICRNIGVDIRYVLFVIDRIGGAGYLLDEMKFSRKK